MRHGDKHFQGFSGPGKFSVRHGCDMNEHLGAKLSTRLVKSQFHHMMIVATVGEQPHTFGALLF
jgi:hypothetical protein